MHKSKIMTNVQDTHCVVWVEDVGGGGVVNDDDLVEVATEAT